MTVENRNEEARELGERPRAKRGFAAMEPEKQRAIARKGGISQGRQNNPGNFANDRAKASLAGRKGGESRGAQHR